MNNLKPVELELLKKGTAEISHELAEKIQLYHLCSTSFTCLGKNLEARKIDLRGYNEKSLISI